MRSVVWCKISSIFLFPFFNLQPTHLDTLFMLIICGVRAHLEAT